MPDLCTTVPIFHGERLIAFAQVFGHHDDVGGMVPGSLPVHATSIFQEGLLVPPHQALRRGASERGRIRRSSAATRGSPTTCGATSTPRSAPASWARRRIVELCDRYGADVVEAGFQALIDKCARMVREELLPKIADGVYAGRTTSRTTASTTPRLHTIRLTMTKTAEKLVLDFTGTDPRPAGPINWAANYGE